MVKKLPFKYKFVISFLIIETFFLSLIIIFNYTSIKDTSQKLLDKKIKISTELFINLIKTPMIIYDLATIDDVVKSFVNSDDISYLQINDNENRVISEYKSQIFGNNINSQVDDYIIKNKDIYINEEQIGTLKIIYDITNIKKELNYITNTILILAFIELILSITISYIIGRKLSNAIEQLQQGVQDISKNEDKPINLNIKTSDELEYLANSFVNMQNTIISRNKTLKDLNKNLEDIVYTRTQELLSVNKKLSDSIKVASYIQKSILPEKETLAHFFDDFFIYYKPKDIVSGDIYLFERLSKDELLIFNIDCTGHGVSGAFVTMLVKAIQKDILKIHDKNHMLFMENAEYIDTSKILNLLNFQLKSTLNQQNINSSTISDVGLDGCVLYINKKSKLGILSSANSNIFTVDNNGIIKEIKSDKYSIGYKKSQLDFEFSNHFIDFTNTNTIYLTTDGFLDQLGGAKGFPFAKRRFKELIDENLYFDLKTQKEKFKHKIEEYQGENENTDDRSIVALRFSSKISCNI
jgi:serine phosphatase RsbU (regulator of sigma subunit)